MMNVPPASRETGAVLLAGLGAQSALGRTVLATAAAARARVTAAAQHPYIMDRLGDRVVVARAPWLRTELSLERRIIDLAGDAAEDALEALVAPLGASRARVAMMVGLPAARPGLTPGFHDRVCGHLETRIRQRIPLTSTRGLALGHVAGLAAIEQGCQLISGGTVDACLVGGVDSYIDRITLEWLDWTGSLHQSTNPRGFIPGEAAGFCLLVSESLARSASLRPLASVLGTATTREKKLRRDRAVCVGEGLTEAFRTVLGSLPEDKKVDQLLSDYNGQPHRAEEYGFAATRVGDRFRNASQVNNPADCWGDVGAASGPLLTMLAVVGAIKGYAAKGYALVWTSAMIAERTAALFRVDTAQE
jgi:3-oxoacyl-[acyl-carrier-protein] synthase-1